MPKRNYSPEDRKLVRRLLLLHSGDATLVHQLTGFPKRTIQHWRQQWDDDYELYTDTFAQNLLARAKAKGAFQSPSNTRGNSDAAIAQSEDSFAQYAQLREKLMEHANTLANNLMLGDGFVNQRVHALTRLLDRILSLDELLTDQNAEQTEQTIRFEHYYDNAVHEHPPWASYDMSSKEGFMRYAEDYLKGALQSWYDNQRLQQGHVDVIFGEDNHDDYLDELRDRLDYSV